MALRIVKHGKSRFWALYDGDELISLTSKKEAERRMAQHEAQQLREAEWRLQQAKSS